MWFFILNKSPTWDNLQKINSNGLGRCSLCKKDNESVPHLVLWFPFTKPVWVELHRYMGIDCRCEGENIEATLKACMKNLHSKLYKALLLIASQGIWIDQNLYLFEGG
jgi:hypothetical protein